MARTEGGKSIAIYDDEVLLTEDVISIDFSGNVSGSVESLGNVKETFTGGSPGTLVKEIVSGSGTSFTLAHTPVSIISVVARGQTLYPSGSNQGYSIIGTALTTNDSWATGDILVTYYY